MGWIYFGFIDWIEKFIVAKERGDWIMANDGYTYTFIIFALYIGES